MNNHWIERARPSLQTLQPYQPGKPTEDLARELGLSSIVKLASNENPLGCSSAVTALLANPSIDLARYPDANGYALKEVLSSMHGVSMEQAVLGNGSNEILELIARAYAGPGDEIIFSEYAFAVYPIATQVVGASPVIVPAKDWGYDLEAILAAITEQTKVIYIANPNNPTGTYLSAKPLRAFLEKVRKDILVVVDEAYHEYVEAEDYQSMAPLLGSHDNLIVTRTFSKAYGLASLRLGYSLSHPQIADILNRIRAPFNVNSIALAAGVVALEDQDFVRASVQLNNEGLKHLCLGCTELGLDFIPSVGNFICVDFAKDAGPIYQALLHEGVITRPVANYKMPNHLRVTVGTEQENLTFMNALTKVMNQ